MLRINKKKEKINRSLRSLDSLFLLKNLTLGTRFKASSKSSLKLSPGLVLLLTTLFIFANVLFIQLVSADTISINAGGSTEIAVTPDKYVEGFFSGITATAFCGDGIVQISNGETCDDGNLISGDGCSSACLIEVVIPPDDGGGGGGGGGGVITPPTNIVLEPSWNTDVGLRLAIDTTSDQTITVTNNGGTSVTVTLTHTFGDHLQVIGKNTLTIPGKQSAVFNLRFIAGSTPGTVAGVIRVSDKSVLTSMDVKTKLLLFDSNIVVLNPGLKVTQGGALNTLITLIPLGDPERLDVTLNFMIKDYTNKVYLTKSETLLVTNLTELKRTFDVGLLTSGDYIVGLELIYPNGVAPSSAHFRIVEKRTTTLFGNITLFLVIMILVVAIFILLILIWRRRKKD